MDATNAILFMNLTKEDFNQLTGFNIETFWNSLPVAVETKSIGSQDYGPGFHGVPTFLSTCPTCGMIHKWGTTGIILEITCKECKMVYKPW